MAGSKRRRSSRNSKKKNDTKDNVVDIVEALHRGKRHRAHVLEVETGDDTKMYYVHYEGWNSRYDEWLPEDKVFPLDDKSKVVLEPADTPAKSENTRATKADTAIEKENKATVKEEMDDSGVKEQKKESTDQEMSYEQMRLENIRRNQEMLAKLNLQAHAASLKPKGKKKIVRRSSKKASIKREPSRRSLRVQGLTADGEKLPDNFRALPKGAYKPERVHEEASMEISASNKDFLKQLTENKTKDGEETAEVGVSTLKYAERLAMLQVDEQSVEKLTPKRVYSAALHPSTDTIMGAVGDKIGNLALWKVGSSKKEAGVVSFHPHANVVSGLMFGATNPNKLYSCSYDGRIRMLDLQKQAFDEIYQTNEDRFYVMDFIKNSENFYISSSEGFVRKIDPRAKKVVEEFALHDNKIFTVSVNQENPYELCTASLDRTMRLWDARKIGKGKPKPIHEMVHGLSVTGASYSPDGKYIVSCCNDHYLRVWNTAKLTAKSSDEDGPVPDSRVRHNNKTGRWLTKFRCYWDPKQQGAFTIGSMERPRCIEVFGVNEDASSTSLIMRLRDDNVASVQSINVPHPKLDVILSANSSGRGVMWTKA